jgi:putative spermidine/putrescine transport system permease protein
MMCSPSPGRPVVSEPHLVGVIRWSTFLWPSLLVATVLLLVPQSAFFWMSLHKNLGMGLVSETLTLDNYRRVLSDPFYLGSLWLTFRLSVIATLIALTAAFPTAYALARTRSRLASLMIVLVLITSFMTVVIKALGLSLVLGQEGALNRFLQAIGILPQPLALLNNDTGVVIGLVQYTLPLLVMLMFSVLQTIPPNLEEAAELHGATRLATFRRVILPLAMPGVIAGGLISFNLDMGAFTSAVLLGGGKVLTLPVLIQRKIALDIDYPLAACLATVLVAIVFAFNLLSLLLLRRRGRAAVGGTAQ